MCVCDVLGTNLDGIVAERALAARRQLAPAAESPPLVLLDHLPVSERRGRTNGPAPSR